MGKLRHLINDRSAAAAAEMALVVPLLLVVMLGSMELGNFFMDEHALEKQVRDGARFGARLEIAEDFSCSSDPSTVFADASASTQIVNVTKTGAVSGSGNPRWGAPYWSRNCDGGAQTVAVSVRCVPKTDIDTDETGSTGIYTSLAGNTIPVVSVQAAVKYRSVLGTLGFDATDICMHAESEAPVQGL
jgi:Flp pilus assembly protein TadG